jgi:hypothetical protein
VLEARAVSVPLAVNSGTGEEVTVSVTVEVCDAVLDGMAVEVLLGVEVFEGVIV